MVEEEDEVSVGGADVTHTHMVVEEDEVNVDGADVTHTQGGGGG